MYRTLLQLLVHIIRSTVKFLSATDGFLSHEGQFLCCKNRGDIYLAQGLKSLSRE